MQENPLVSIIVITYNCSRYVLETLESARAQTYQNIELLVSDDCSTDKTMDICRNWIDENKERFVRTELITVPENTGIPANCNRGVMAAHGKWIKFIAGDDILMGTCIEDYLAYLGRNKEAQIICANVIKFNTEGERQTRIQDWKFFSNDITADEQYKLLLRFNRVLASGVFIEKKIIVQLNGFDESLPLIEDYPMWLKITAVGIKIHCLDKPVVRYRLSESGISCMLNKKNQKLIPNIFRQSTKVRMKYCLRHLSFFEKLDLLYTYFIDSVFLKLGNNKTKLTSFLLFVTKIFNPFILYRKVLLLLHIKYIHIDYIKD